MLVRLKVQRHIALFHRAVDSGDWVATCCRRGAEELLGRRLRANDDVLVDLRGEIVDAVGCDVQGADGRADGVVSGGAGGADSIDDTE